MTAFKDLQKYYNVHFVETYHSSDEHNLYITNHNEEDTDASLTLNMLKIKQENLRNLTNLAAHEGDHCEVGTGNEDIIRESIFSF